MKRIGETLCVCRDCIRSVFSAKARAKMQKRRLRCNVLAMTLVVKNEEETIEKSIRFHHAMGVDGFIVSSHNSTDKTNSILERLLKEGLVWKVFYRDSPDHKHSKWVNEMVLFARECGADWVINADGDEFFYSDCLNLKQSIQECGLANALWVDSIFLFPDNKDNFFDSTYFVTRPLQEFEACMLGVSDNKLYADYIGSQGCTKVIHHTKGFVSVTDGNHGIVMRNRIMCRAAGIRLYHYHIRNFKGYEQKVMRWLSSAPLMPEGQGEHMKEMLRIYERGLLLQDFNKKFSADVLENLVRAGVVVNDPSVRNFMVKEGLI